MRIRLLIVLGLLINICMARQALAQKMPPPRAFGNTIYFNGTVTDAMRASGTETIGVGINNDNTRRGLLLNTTWLSRNNVKSPMLGVKLNPALTNYRLSPVKSFYKSYSAYRISDQSNATLIALGITKNNINDFRYHVVLNDSVEVIHWSPIPKLEQNYGADAPYGFIGKFNYPGKQILVEVVNTKDYQQRDGVIFDWRKNFRPVITNIKLVGQHLIGPDHDTTMIIDRKSPNDYTIKYDTATGAPSAIKFAYDTVRNIEIFLKDHESVRYNISFYRIENGKKVYSGSPIDEGGSQTHLIYPIKLQYQPDNYEMVIQPYTNDGNIEGQAVNIQVVILPPPFSIKKVFLEQWKAVLVALVISLLFFVFYMRRSYARLAMSMQEKQMANLKIRSIRSQLNPHFMFNALTSIQNLVNKKDIDSANHYLSRFADLTRKVLNTGERDLISLEDELKILDDYLQMEQLRFNFKYELNIDAGINAPNIEVPAMLLQPFVENAVKHGVAGMREEGLIKVQIGKTGKDLLLSVIDNGRGFRPKKEDNLNASFGLKLSEERIGLLKEIYKDQPAILNIQSAETGTNVTITLTNWVS